MMSLTFGSGAIKKAPQLRGFDLEPIALFLITAAVKIGAVVVNFLNQRQNVD